MKTRTEHDPGTEKRSARSAAQWILNPASRNSFMPASCAWMLALGILPLVCSCTVITYLGPGGERFSRTSFGSATSLSTLIAEAGTNGVRRVELRGYRSEASQVLGVVTEAAVRGATQPR